MADYADAVFDGIKSLKDDWGLRIEAVSVSLPTPKLVTQSIPGADGVLDLTDAFGYVAYNNRKIVITASIIEDIDDWSDLLSEILAYLHGQSRNVTFDFDSTHYYVGRFAVDASLADAINTITITGDVHPFRFCVNETNIRVAVSGVTAQSVYGGRMGVIPIITSTVAMPVSFNEHTYALSQGINEITDIFLVEGENILVFGQENETEGEIVITYREGVF